ncbi:MAG TPA: FAD-linked oxidase C-terminal domain-containing protein [Blastocatellia bacterium]|nr:FAD-linked oxidase C-terminal domain-containing protein [Blastocatellia bacterium]
MIQTAKGNSATTSEALNRKLPDSVLNSIRSIVGDANVLESDTEILPYECDGMMTHRYRPSAIVLPTSSDQVAPIVRVLAEHSIPFVARGAGTGLSGGALATNGAVVIEMARLNRILEIDYDNRLAVVETGLVNIRLSQAVNPDGFYYAPDPSSQTSCTIGGNVAESAGGPHCLKYGTTTNHVIGLEVVLPSGEVVRLGGCGADDIGYDLLGVFVGGEGTLGVATKTWLRLLPSPQTVKTMLIDFMSVEETSKAVSEIIATGIVPAALEMMDGATIRAVEASIFATGMPVDAAAVLIVELDGLEAGMDETIEQIKAIAEAHGGRKVYLAEDATERARIWAGRKGAFGALGRVSPDLMIQDAVIPRTKLPEVLSEVYRISERYNLRLSNVFHAGDGNLHPNISFDSRNQDEVRRVTAASKEIMELCVHAGGSITGEHGVGLDKINYMPLIFSDADLEAMHKVRDVFNPNNLANPDKVIPMHRCRAF